jgi:hypothetical protein
MYTIWQDLVSHLRNLLKQLKSKILSIIQIRKVPGFKYDFNPDHRDGYAKTWPKSIEDHECSDFGWEYKMDLEQLADLMYSKIKANYF